MDPFYQPIDLSAINWLAVVAAALAFYAIGAVWYTFLFGKAWMKEVNMTPEDAKKANLTRVMLLTLLFTLVMVATLALRIGSPEAGPLECVLYGFLTGFGWVAMGLALNAVYEMRSWRYILINGGYMVTGFTVAGLILGYWK